MPVAIWLILLNVPLRAAYAAVSILPNPPRQHTLDAANRGAARIRTSGRLVREKGEQLLPEAFRKRLGLGPAGIDRLAGLTRGGWHHMRVLRFPAASRTTERGIGAHTDYGLLVIAAQDEVGGLFVRPPADGERRPRNWLPGESTAGFAQDSPGWTYVAPVRGC
ncbi:hypothetical protein [Streptomyces sp. 147326]|uniref:hypothetical protein n=1 Tax=Streptomyces sp. 147326 TaxID=3074379 RepID=UPI0038576EC2